MWREGYHTFVKEGTDLYVMENYRLPYAYFSREKCSRSTAYSTASAIMCGSVATVSSGPSRYRWGLSCFVFCCMTYKYCSNNLANYRAVTRNRYIISIPQPGIIKEFEEAPV